MSERERESLLQAQELVLDYLDRTNAGTRDTRAIVCALDAVESDCAAQHQRNHELREEIQRLEAALREIVQTDGMYEGIVSDLRHVARAALAGEPS